MTTKNDDEMTKDKYYTFEVSPHIHGKIEKLIFMLKKLDDCNINKQSWILNAVKERLLSADETGTLKNVKEKTLHFKIDEFTSDLLEKEIAFTKNFRRSFSKKQWILEAIQEKIERDEKKLKDLLEKIKK